MGRLIDADALIKRLRTMPVPYLAHPNATYLDNCAAGINDAIKEVVNAPTIDAVPVVHGRWEFHYMGANKDKVFAECPECGAVFTLNAFDFGLCYNYCPNCGAKMDLEEDGE